MQKINKKVLLTRIIADDLIRIAIDKGIQIKCLPFISIEYIENQELRKKISALADQHCQVILTSAHAVHALSIILGDQKPDWNIYCIGPITTAAATDFFGRDKIILTASYASKLGEEIIKHHSDKSFLFFCGDKRLDTLPEMFKNAGINSTEIIVYKNISTPHLLNENFDGIGFFSPSAVESFLSTNPLPESAVCFSIGHTTTAAIKRFSNSLITESIETNQQGMIETIINYYQPKI